MSEQQLSVPPFEEIDIRDILPQRPPFLFVDHILDYNEENATVETSFTIPNDSLFTDENGQFQTPGIMENMAQCSAARIGFRAKYILHVPVEIGYIGTVKNFTLVRSPRVGETLVTKLHLNSEIFGISLCEAEVWIGDELIAKSILKTAMPTEKQQ